MSRQRVDRDAWRKQWPVLYDRTPQEGVLVQRDATIEFALHANDQAALRKLAQSMRISIPGLVLRIFTTHLYGRYALVKMHLERRGLFARGDGSEDPAVGSQPTSVTGDISKIEVPKRMRDDLDALAQREGVDISVLTGAIIRAHLFGHPALASQQ